MTMTTTLYDLQLIYQIKYFIVFCYCLNIITATSLSNNEIERYFRSSNVINNLTSQQQQTIPNEERITMDVYTYAYLNYSFMENNQMHLINYQEEKARYGEGKILTVHGQLIHISDVNDNKNDTACTNNISGTNGRSLPSNGIVWIALVRRGHCTFEEKVRNVHSKGAAGIIIYNDKPVEHLEKMQIKGKTRNITAVITYRDIGLAMAMRLDNNINVTAHIIEGRSGMKKITTFNKTSVLFVAISFIILMLVSLVWLIIYYVQRFRNLHAKDQHSRHLCSVTQKAIMKIPTRTGKMTDDKDADSDCCAICIETYRISDLIRVLPCKHEFHKNCIDPWLIEHRTCPMCKLDVLKYYGYVFLGSEESFLEYESDQNTSDTNNNNNSSSSSSSNNNNNNINNNIDINQFASLSMITNANVNSIAAALETTTAATATETAATATTTAATATAVTIPGFLIDLPGVYVYEEAANQQRRSQLQIPIPHSHSHPHCQRQRQRQRQGHHHHHHHGHCWHRLTTSNDKTSLNDLPERCQSSMSFTNAKDWLSVMIENKLENQHDLKRTVGTVGTRITALQDNFLTARPEMLKRRRTKSADGRYTNINYSIIRKSYESDETDNELKCLATNNICLDDNLSLFKMKTTAATASITATSTATTITTNLNGIALTEAISNSKAFHTQLSKKIIDNNNDNHNDNDAEIKQTQISPNSFLNESHVIIQVNGEDIIN